MRKSKSQPGKIIVLPGDIAVPFREGQTVLEAALGAGIPLPHSCGGMGTCTTCRVLVVKGLEKCHERTELEAQMAEDRGFAEFERLSCQLEAVAGLELQIPDGREGDGSVM